MSEEGQLLKFKASPSEISVDLERGKLFTNKDTSDPDAVVDLESPLSVANMSGTLSRGRPEWITNFYGSMNDFIQTASPKAQINTSTGELLLDPSITKSDTLKLCSSLASMVESTAHQTKATLIWIGELILDHIAKSPHDLSIENAIEELGLTKRENGIHWSVKSLARWPAVVQRIPNQILQLPIPSSYLTEAAMFKAPDDPVEKIKFNNARDALLLQVSENQSEWSRSKFVSCMKELQDAMCVDRRKMDSVASMYHRLVLLYRIRNEAHLTPNPAAYYASIRLGTKDVANWIYSIEAELITRGKLEADPKNEVPHGHGLSKASLERIEEAQTTGKIPINV